MLCNLFLLSVLFSAVGFRALASMMIADQWLAMEETLLPGSLDLDDRAPTGYKAVPLRWFGQAFANGPNITIVGKDIEHIYSELKKRNPDFDDHNEKMLQLQANVTGQAKAITTRDVEPNHINHEDGYTICIRNSMKFGAVWRLREGVDYLRKLSGLCIVDGPKHSCNRCSCSYKAAIFMCNDSNRGVTHQFMYCSDMGNRASTVLDDCKVDVRHPLFNGQFFQTEYEYSVLLTGDDC